MKRLFFCLLLSVSYFAHAQTRSHIISGSIVGKQNNKLESVTVELYKNDSILVKSAFTNKEGYFEFSNLSFGTYKLKASEVGYQGAQSGNLVLDEAHPAIIYNDFNLQESSKEMQQVVVQTKKPLIEQKLDRTIVNVGASVTNAGSTVLEVLEKSPGVTVDKDGNVSLKGKQGVTILIDGKPSYLSGADLANLLKSMNANQIDQIEIMTNPSAKYDAAGNAGIINLKTKKVKYKGFNGNVNLNYGQSAYAKTNNSINLNYRNNKFNMFLNYSYTNRKGWGGLYINRTYSDNNKTLTAAFEQPTSSTVHNTNNTLKVGMDYTLSKKTTIGFVASGFVAPDKFIGKSTGYIEDAERNVAAISTSSSINEHNWKNKAANLNFDQKFDSIGTELTADVDYLTYNSASAQSFENDAYSNNWELQGQETIRGELPVNIKINSGKMDFTKSFKSGLKLETGWKSSVVNTDNASNYFNLNNNNWEPDYSKTNHFVYSENINAGYVNLNKQYKKWGVQTGLRFENTNYNGRQFDNPTRQDSSFSHQYNSFFPTAFVSYHANDKNQFSLSVGRRIDRPAYQDLNPFIYYINKYTYVQGNPFLKPQYTRNIEFTHIYKNFLTTSLNYSLTNDGFAGIFRSIGDTTILTTGNLAKKSSLGLSINVEIPVRKWWSMSVNGNAQYVKVDGSANGEAINSTGTNFSFNMNNQFKFNKGWSAELSGFYNSRNKDGQFIIAGFGVLNAGVSKQIIDNKLSASLNVKDIFSSSIINGIIHYENVEEHFHQTHDSRMVNIGLVYRFGKAFKNNTRRNNSTSDEQSRVKAG
jgi:outer membrane receptor protein involved in Fe transport